MLAHLRSVLITLLIAAASSSAMARSISPAQANESLKRADVVIDATVSERHTDDSSKDCGATYSVTDAKYVKGLPSGKITFGYDSGLEVKKKYRLYLRHDPDNTKIIKHLKSLNKSSPSELAHIAACKESLNQEYFVFRADRLK